MGRKRKVSSAIGKDAAEDSTIVEEDKTSNACPETTTAEEKLDLHADKTNPMEPMNVENKVQPNSSCLQLNKSNSRVLNVAVRRSARFKNSELPAESQGEKPVVEHVNLDINEIEEALNSQQVGTLPVVRKNNLEKEPQAQQVSTVTDVKERTLEEKVDYLVQTVDEFKPKIIRRPKEGPNFSYKSLYIDSQKKIEALMEQNYELVKKLEYARGKVEAYEKMKDTVGAPKEVVLVSTLGKATEGTIHLSPQTVQKSIPLQPPPPPPAPAPAAALPSDVAAENPKRKKKNYKKRTAKR